MLDQAQRISWAIALKDNPDFFQSRNHARLLLQGSRACQDPCVIEHLKQIFELDLQTKGLNDSSNLFKFVEQAHQWLKMHSTNKIQGLDNLQRDFTAGTTQSFDSFYWRHRSRKMRCFKGEYFYHLKTWIATGVDWSFVSESAPLTAGDALVISLPFCDTGNQVNDIDSVLQTCNRLNIPVLIDCCYYTISSGIVADLNHDCVDTVAFSLSKSFPVANLRIGLRYTKSGTLDGQYLMNSIGYNNSLSAFVGCKIIEKFSCDYIYDTYYQRQQEVCNYFQLEPSQSVIFAVGDSQWNMYNRSHLLKTYQLELDAEQFCNRICLVSIFDNWNIFELIKNETIS